MNNSSSIWFFILVPLCITLFLYLLGDWLEGSEWTDVITNAKIRTSGSTCKENSICPSRQCCSVILYVKREF